MHMPVRDSSPRRLDENTRLPWMLSALLAIGVSVLHSAAADAAYSESRSLGSASGDLVIVTDGTIGPPVRENGSTGSIASSSRSGVQPLAARELGEAGSICGDANYDGNVTAADALQALRTAVGSGSCVLPRCDYNDDREIKTSDALAILRTAVGSVLEPGCPAYPVTPAELDLALEQISDVSTQARALVEAAIAQASEDGTTVDVDALVEAIALLDGVESAELGEDASTIIVKSDSGMYFNILLLNTADDRLFVPDPTAMPQGAPATDLSETGNFFLYARERVEGNKALILAPFDFQGFGDANAIQGLLETAGFVVTSFKNEAATLDRFRGDYLQQFDVLYVATHGGYGALSTGGEATTLLATGQPSSDRTFYDALSAEQKDTVTSSTVSGVPKSYWIVTVPWLKMTNATDFRHALFFTIACKSATDSDGPGSLVDQMLERNLGAFVGFDRDMFILLGSAMAKTAMTHLSNGENLADACNKTRNSPSIQFLNYTLILQSLFRESVSFGPANFRCFQRLAEPFFLTDADESIGVATLTPSSGPPGTPVVFSVVFKPAIASSVGTVTIDIDNTGEHLMAQKISTTTWTFTQLVAPGAVSYPRVDTFTFTAFDFSFEELGQGAATFTILQPTAAASLTRPPLPQGYHPGPMQ